MVLKINPIFKSLIPPLTSEEYEQLATNLVNDGCREPILTWNGYIIDGHNRYEICTKRGINYTVVDINQTRAAWVKKLETEDEVIEWIIPRPLIREGKAYSSGGDLRFAREILKAYNKGLRNKLPDDDLAKPLHKE